MIAGCGQRPGRSGGSLGALPRCSSAPASLFADLRSIVYSIHVRRMSEPNAAFAYLLHVYETSDFIDEPLHVLAALSRFPFVKLKTRALEWAVAGGVRSQDIHGVFGSVAADCLKGVCAGQVGRFERTVLADRHGTSHHGGRSVLGRPPQGAFTRSLAQFLENIRTGAAMYARDMTLLAAWIQKL
ncbi:hypothetical protein H257_19426 [Aphanomyces astaci]|uniref:ERAP1-like C-terminal domain-containing protein n=1 Tax=Aphanomyces astaci TaxID=112090 RepID=W4FAB3_APHAT|nr:hypothetical protein H257_19426 [Aphanomyces astaci]ETV63643.1 hypothetical protein H257_19426 [Aphanomyces astaci]|eukprot:XP_009846873.1 hypothetical protein H257_19426 [Aphanomyces astaci]